MHVCLHIQIHCYVPVSTCTQISLRIWARILLHRGDAEFRTTSDTIQTLHNKVSRKKYVKKTKETKTFVYSKQENEGPSKTWR